MSDSTTPPWIETYTGRKFSLLSPAPEMVSIEDIAHSLANLCRFNGHTSRFYSVAEHSIRVYSSLAKRRFPPRLQALGLLHDAAEAYTGDITRPMKACLTGLLEITRKIDAAILACLKIAAPDGRESEIIRQADWSQLGAEAFYLMPSNGLDWDMPAFYLMPSNGLDWDMPAFGDLWLVADPVENPEERFLREWAYVGGLQETRASP